ncbi:MAG: sigma-54-dependent Fis family transcriptional regulator [Deltaproteobacteria bacterium]|nr:MAG: sigma-54-dependent Fis family transcriptional regulator [Deltaproteobacteria bacterium]
MDVGARWPSSTSRSPTPTRRPMSLDILLVDDEPTLLAALGDILEDVGHRVLPLADGDRAYDALQPGRFDVVITDVRLPGRDGHDIARKALQLCPAPAVILMTAFGEVPRAVEMLKLGARNYLTKPVDEDTLLAEVSRIEEGLGGAMDLEEQGVVARAPEMQACIRLAQRLARSDLPLLIHGETGVGKEVLARTIHASSPRQGGPFVAANCSALSPELIDSELFGHARGAFTGAHEARAGWLRSASGGTLFLDEVAELPPAAQARLLRALETGEVRPVGADRTETVDVRLVAATHSDLDERVKQGEFRQDLLFRLRGFQIVVPPLRQRPEDIPPLARLFLQRAAARLGNAPPEISDEAMGRLLSWHWPGNVRELKHVIETAAVLSEGAVLQARDLRFGGLPEPDEGDALDLRAAARRLEIAQIRRALAMTDGNRSKAATLLGISRKHLWDLMRKHGLSD